MSKLIEIKRRIKSTKNIRQVTRAMEMVASVKFKKINSALKISNKYIAPIEHTLKILSTYKEKDILPRSDHCVLVLLAPSKGFVGPLTINILNTAKNFLEQNKNKEFKIVTVGKKASSFAKSMSKEVLGYYPDIPAIASINDLYDLTDLIIDEYINNRAESVYICYPKFINILSNKVVVEKFLPIEYQEEEYESLHFTKSDEKDSPSLYTFYQGFEELYESCIKTYTLSMIYAKKVESSASEHASRMMTMRNATDNASKLNMELQIERNKVRQQSITQEVIEIASASENTI